MRITKIIKQTIKDKIGVTGMHQRMMLIQEALGRIETRQVLEKVNDFNDSGFRVYSQWGEDGIIQFLINKIHIKNKNFIEFGVENYTESNTRFLLLNNNWSGLVMDGDHHSIDFIKNDKKIYWGSNLKAKRAFITKENINNLISEEGLIGDIGILSIDIDGNDYWIWEAIDCVSPRIVICEYNSLFGPKSTISTPYADDFIRTRAHYSNLYYGTSISALEYLGKQKGYSLVGSNNAGNNIFFVRNDLIGDLKVLTAEECYQKSKFKESLDESGKLTFLDHSSGIKLIGDMKVIDVIDDKEMTIKGINVF
jgi:hypothetical protein